MKKLFFLFFLLPLSGSGQPVLISGTYGEMDIAYDKQTQNITGYYEDYTGSEEGTKIPKFSCIFYLEGKISGDKMKVKTYYPKDSSSDVIFGELKLINNKEITVHLPEEHGGCWNVQHFVDEPVDLKLDKNENWIQIRFVSKDKAYFYSAKSELNKQKAYILKGDVVYIEKIENDWAFCSFRPVKYKTAKQTTGWLKLEYLNSLN